MGLPSQAYLLNRYRYDPVTGLLTHADSGRPALSSVKGDTGYLIGGLDGKTVRSHRVIWKMVHGTEPIEIDHINGNPSDNRLANLREVSHQINQRNRRKHKNNSSGVTGVHCHNQTGRWRARVWVDGKKIDLGTYATISEAAAARRAALAKHGFSARHGTE